MKKETKEYILNDTTAYYNLYETPCIGCSHHFEHDKLTCDAFPKGIPDVILSGKNKHTEVLKEQKNDITYSSR